MSFFSFAGFNGACGAGLVIKLGRDKVIKGWLKVGFGINTHVEVVGLWSLLFCAKSWSLKYLPVLGDSQVIINWALGEAHVKSFELNHWLENTKSLMKDFFF